MNNKKGVGLELIISFIILLVLLAVVIGYIIWGPDAVLQKLASWSDSIADSILGPLRKEQMEQSSAGTSKDVESSYENIVSALRNEGTGPCLLNYRPLTADFKGHKIILSKSDNGIFVELMDKRGISVKQNTIGGKIPCVVGEGEAARNFYDNYLKGVVCEPKCKNDYSIANIEIKDSESIYINGKKRSLKMENLLFKAKDGNVCFFPTYSGMFTLPGCDAASEGSDDDCIKEIKRFLQVCGQETKPTSDSPCNTIDYCYKQVTLYGNARPDLICEDTSSQPTAFFREKEDCVKGSECIKGRLSGTAIKNFKTCDDSNKETDSLRGGFIWVWPKYIQR